MNAPKPQPKYIVTNWRRFSMGLWRIPRGDIADAYSASTFPKVTVFKYDGRLYTNGGCDFSRWLEAKVSGHLLIPAAEYRGAKSVKYSYEGREVIYRGQPFRLGEKILFVASEPTLEEWLRQIRIFYADGGYFASGCTYHEFLLERFKITSGNGVTAREMELAECAVRPMPQTQEEMRRLLGGETSITEERYQMRFTL